MAKVKKEPEPPKTDADLALEHLLGALDTKNETYSPGIENARLDAAELLLKLTTPGDNFNNAAFEFLRRAVAGQIPTLGAQNRVRAAGIIIRNTRGIL